MVFNRRTLVGCACLGLFLLIVVTVRITVEQPSPQHQDYTFGEATLHFETDRSWVWQPGDCVTLRWQVDHIGEIYWFSSGANHAPTIGANSTAWCVSRADTPVYFDIRLRDGQTLDLSPLGVNSVRNPLLLTLFPLLLLAGWCFGLDRPLVRALGHVPEAVRATFSISGQVRPLLVVLFLGVNAVVLWNTIYHEPLVGYDAQEHYAYALTLSRGQLPTLDDSGQYYSPPLAYMLPALVSRIGGITDTCSTEFDECFAPIRKLGQLQNVLLSLIATLMLLRIGARLYPDSLTPRAGALFLLGTLPVYYKSFSFMRGEPFIVTLSLLLVNELLALTRRPPSRRDALIIGVYGGLILLSRQVGALVLIGIALWWLLLLARRKAVALRLFFPALAASLIALILGGWFYLALQRQTGTVLAFNRPTDSAPKPAQFFTGLGGPNVFIYPFTPGYDGQVLPIFYTETWGDYFGYFYVARPPIPARLPASALSYLGRINALAVLPTLVLLGGFAWGVYAIIHSFIRPATDTDLAHSLFALCIVASVLGFGWFLAHYPSTDGDTAKATYLLQIFPFLCLLGGHLLYVVERRLFRVRAPQVVVVLLVLVAIHNFPAFFSRIGQG